MAIDDFEAFRIALDHGFCIPDKILSAIGLVMVCQALTEAMFTLNIATLLAISQHDARSMTAKMSFRSMCDALQSLVFSRIEADGADAREFENLVKRLKSFEEFRNHVAHSVWAYVGDFEIDQAQSVKVGRRKDSSFQIQTKNWSLEDISKKIMDCKEAEAYLTLLVQRIMRDH